MKTSLKKWAAVTVGMSLLLSACGGQSGNSDATGNTNTGDTGKVAKQPEPEKPKEPVTLNFFYNGYSGTLTDELKQKVEAKFPHIKLNIILDKQGSTIQDTMAAGIPIDLTAYSMGGLFRVMDLKLASDLRDLVKKHNFDTGRFAEGVYETALSYSGNGELLVMPYELNNNVLIYNKNIFDKFGVPYPTDGMTWEQMYDIVRKVSRVESGVQYKGFAYSGLNLIYKNQLGLTFVDPATNKATVNNDGWKRWVEVMAGFHHIPNNDLNGREDDLFFKEQTLAMRAGPSPLELLEGAVESGLRWDAVQLPSFENSNSGGNQMNAPFYTIPPSSRYRDEAFEVIAFLLSDEIQTANARKGRVPVVKSPSVIKDFGVDLPILQGTNYAKAVFADKIGKPITVTKFDGQARSILSWELPKVSRGEVDVNTMLRSAEEQINKYIEEQLKK